MSETGKSLITVAFVVCCVFGCSWYNSYKKEKQKEELVSKKHQDSVRAAFIKDSLEHDPRYQDSVRKAKIEQDRLDAINDSISREEVVGFVFLGDSCYHSTFHYQNYSVWDIPKLRFVSRQECLTNHYLLCSECEKTEDVVFRYEDGTIIDIDDIPDYIIDNYDDFEYIFENNRPEPDFDNDRW